MAILPGDDECLAASWRSHGRVGTVLIGVTQAPHSVSHGTTHVVDEYSARSGLVTSRGLVRLLDRDVRGIVSLSQMNGAILRVIIKATARRHWLTCCDRNLTKSACFSKPLANYLRRRRGMKNPGPINMLFIEWNVQPQNNFCQFKQSVSVQCKIE